MIKQCENVGVTCDFRIKAVAGPILGRDSVVFAHELALQENDSFGWLIRAIYPFHEVIIYPLSS